MSPRPLGKIGATLAGPLLVLASGCIDQPMNRGPAADAQAATPAPAPAADPDQPALRKVIGQTTQDVLNLQEEQAKHPGEGQVSDMKIKATDYVTLQGNAYVTTVGKIAIDQITYALRLFEATEGRYPNDYEEFMQRIIRENNIELPQLPASQEYAYDEQNHRLVVLEYPEREEALKAQIGGRARP